MIDFHSHILPGIDDGSENVEMSLRMVADLKEQGADTICATSHFYATERTPQRFLFRREEAFEALKVSLPADSPRILLGAEVLYFPGIAHMEELPSLCLEGTNLLLLEMPFERWTEYMIREVMEIAHSGRFTILLAHIERYYYQQPVSVWDSFLENNILLQSNADFFLPILSRLKAIRLLKQGRIHLLGSDCHNMSDRVPRLQEARAIIRNKKDDDYLNYIDELGQLILRTGHL